MPRCGCGHYMSSVDSDTEEAEDRSKSRWLNPWYDDDRKFVQTRASRLVESKLHLNKLVLLGEAGCGKTAIAKHIALNYRKNDWRIVEVKNLHDVKRAPVKKVSVLFLINDPIGKSDLDEKSLRMWYLQRKILDEYFSRNKEETRVKPPKIIVTCRSNLPRKEMEFLMNGFTIINLDGDDARLTDREKEDILKMHIDCSYLKDSEVSQLIKTEKSFPLISSIVSTNEFFQKDVLTFFKEPFTQLKREILSLKENSKEKYLCLFLLVLHGNELHKDSFEDIEQDDENLEKEDDKEGSNIEKMDNENLSEEENDDDDSEKSNEDEQCSDNDEEKYKDEEEDDDNENDDDDDDDDDDDEDLDSINGMMLNDLLKTFNLPQSTSRIALFQCLKSLRGHYFVRRVIKIFKITDDSFLLALTRIFCDDIPEKFLKYCKNSFFCTLTTCSTKEDEVFQNIQLEDRFIDPFIERIEEDIVNGTYLDIFLSPWIQEERVLTKLKLRLKNKSKDDLEKILLHSKLDEDDNFPEPGSVLQKKLRGFSRLDLIPLCHDISPIILALVLNMDNLFFAIFSLVKETRTFSEYLKNSSLKSAFCINGRIDFVAQVIDIKDFKNACWSKQEKLFSVHIAANFLQTDILSLILNDECDVNMVTKNNESPLFLAAASDRNTLQNIPWACCKEFDIFDEKFDEILEEKRLQTLSLLVQKGSDVNIHPVQFPSALAYSCQRKNIDIVRILLESGANVNDTGEDKLSALHFASKVGSLDIVTLLLEKGADANMKSAEGLSSLYFASLKGNEAIVELLLTKGTGDELKEKTGYTPFFVACKKGHTNIVKMFLQHTPCIDCRLSTGTTAVFAAVDNGHEKIVEMLIGNGADVNVVRKNKMISPLYSAAAHGYASILETLLNCRLDSNLKTKGGDTPLIVASQNGHFSTVQSLLKSKANVNQVNNFSKAPLHFAAEKDHLDIVSLLLANNADVDLPTKKGFTPLMRASACGHKGIVQELLNHGADVNMTNKQGASALFVASEHGHLEAVKILLANKADVNSCTQYGKSPLFVASEFGHHEIVQELLCHDAEVKENDSRNLLEAPSYSGYVKTVALLAENGAKVNEKDNEGRTPLMNASRRGFTDVVKILLKNGADINICDDEEEENALDMACSMGHSDIVSLLLDHGMDINNNSNDESYTPLMHALEGSHLSTALLLLDRGADVHTKVNGITALYFACSAGFEEVVDILLERKAEVNPKEPDGSLGASPLFAAITEGHYQIVKVLLQNGADINNYKSGYIDQTLLITAVEKDQVGMVKLLLEYGANVNAEDNHGHTALHASAYYNCNANCMSVLLNNEADPNVYNKNGTTPMMMALQKYSVAKECIQALVDHGADVNACDRYGDYTLHHVAMWEDAHILLPLLLDHGADVNIRSGSGQTALHESCLIGGLKTVKILLKYGADVSIRSENGLTALDIAKKEGYKKVIKILSEKLGESGVEKRGSIPSSSLKSYSSTSRKDVVLARRNPLGPVLPRNHGLVKLKKTWR